MILMNDFKREYVELKAEIDLAAQKCLSSGWYILGTAVKEFESLFASYIGSSYCVGVGNGMEAIQIALIALDIGEGDEVLTVSNSAVATALAISNVGAKPVFVDIDEYYHMDIHDLQKKITQKSKAIVPVHLFGQVADMDGIREIAKNYNLKVVEDACQAHGASLHDTKAGAFGEIGCFSFYPTKNLGAYGDGGAITTNSQELYERCLMLRNYGQRNRYEHVIKGLNSRLDELQAAILQVKLTHLEGYVHRRIEIAHAYFEQLSDVPQITLPKIRKSSKHSFHLFVIQADSREELREYLKKNGIETQVHYPIPIHKQECYEEQNALVLPFTEQAANKVLSIPINPFLLTNEVETVSNEIKNYYKFNK